MTQKIISILAGILAGFAWVASRLKIAAYKHRKTETDKEWWDRQY